MAHRTMNQITSIFGSHPILTSVCATAILGAAWTINDYLEWKAFGTGGTPPTWAGYLRMTKIRINYALSSNNLLDPTPLSKDGPSYLASSLPKRPRPRPKIMSRTMPQRQVPEPIDLEVETRLHTLMRDIASAHPDILEVKPSHTEGKSTDGLYARSDTSTLNPVARDKILNHEIAHTHPAENSLHVWLSEPDARVVIEAGWGQRFPLTFVHKGWTMVYAPMNMKELEVVERIVKAGVAWITGVSI